MVIEEQYDSTEEKIRGRIKAIVQPAAHQPVIKYKNSQFGCLPFIAGERRKQAARDVNAVYYISHTNRSAWLD